MRLTRLFPAEKSERMPWVHRVLSLTKRFIFGTHHRVSKAYLPAAPRRWQVSKPTLMNSFAASNIVGMNRRFLISSFARHKIRTHKDYGNMWLGK